MSYKTLEVELENGRVHPRGSETLPAKAHALLTLLDSSAPPVAQTCAELAERWAGLKNLPFDLAQARVHARIWADLQTRGQMIGPHDLQIGAAALALGHEVATLNVQEFQRVTGLKVVDATPFRRP